MSKRKKSRSRLRLIPLIALAMLIAGFLVRRTVMPVVKFHLTHRSPQISAPIEGAPADSHSGGSTQNSDQISDTERHELSGIIRDHSR